MENDPRYFHVSRNGFFKYKGYPIDQEGQLPPHIAKEFSSQRELIYNLINGNLPNDSINLKELNKLEEEKIILGEEIDPFDFDHPDSPDEIEVLIGIFLPARMTEPDPCKVFNEKVIKEKLLDNIRVKDIFYSNAGGGGGEALPNHYLMRIVGNIRTVYGIVSEDIHKTLLLNKIEYGTRIMPLLDYLSNNEYEAFLHSTIVDPNVRNQIGLMMDLISKEMGIDSVKLKRLSNEDIEKMLLIFENGQILSNVLKVKDNRVVDDKLAKLFSGWINGKLDQTKDKISIYEDIADFGRFIANQTEKIIKKNIDQKIKDVGIDIFQAEVVKRGGKKIENLSGLNDLLIATSIWNASDKKSVIVSNLYSEKIKDLQKNKVHQYRNAFSHPSDGFVENADLISQEIDFVTDAIISMVIFVTEFYYTVSS